MATPFQGIYTSTKAAAAMLSDTMRLELEVFGVKVVELKTGLVRSKINKNQKEAKPPTLPVDSIYTPAKEAAQKLLSLETVGAGQGGTPTEEYAKAVVNDLLKKNPPSVIWRGQQAWMGRLLGFFSHGFFDGMAKQMMGFDKVEKIIKG